MDWKNCVIDGNAIKVSVNTERIASLRRSATATLEFVENVKLNENNGSILLKNMYDSVLELMHAYMLSKGYKVLNHLCIGYYLRDELINREYFYLFDKYRKIRNSITYYVAVIDTETARKGLADLKSLFNEVNNLL